MKRAFASPVVLWTACAGVVVLSLGLGALKVAPDEVLRALFAPLLRALGRAVTVDVQSEAVVLGLRLPRVLLAVLVGGTLAASGAALQAVFRNRLADPGLLGVSGGAALGAVFAIIATSHLPALGIDLRWLARWLVPFAAFGGGAAAVSLVAATARVEGRTSSALLLLTGIAIAAIAGTGLGLAMFFANDAELRSITFWTMGSLGGTDWTLIWASAPFMVLGPLFLPRMARALDLLQLGEAEAFAAGVRVEVVKRRVIALVTLGVGAAVAASGIIGFVGLVAPHLARLLGAHAQGPLLRTCIPLGVLLVLCADLVCRTAVQPAELPIGIATGLLGAPLFLSLIWGARKRQLT